MTNVGSLLPQTLVLLFLDVDSDGPGRQIINPAVPRVPLLPWVANHARPASNPPPALTGISPRARLQTTLPLLILNWTTTSHFPRPPRVNPGCPIPPCRLYRALGTLYLSRSRIPSRRFHHAAQRLGDVLKPMTCTPPRPGPTPRDRRTMQRSADPPSSPPCWCFFGRLSRQPPQCGSGRYSFPHANDSESPSLLGTCHDTARFAPLNH